MSELIRCDDDVIRWLPDVPPYSIMRITEAIADKMLEEIDNGTNRIRGKIGKPSTVFYQQYLVNGKPFELRKEGVDANRT